MKPSLDQINARVEYVEEYYQEAHNQFDLDRTYLDRAFPIDVPKDVKAYYPPTAQIALDTGREHVPTNNPRIFVPKASDKPSAQEHKETLRKFYLGLLNRIVSESAISPLDVTVQDLFMTNTGVLKILYAPVKAKADGSDEYETIKRNALPIRILSVPARNFYPDPSDVPEYVIEIYERSAAEIKAKYPNWERPKNASGEYLKTVKWVEYHDAQYRCYLAAGEPILKQGVEKHGYGFIPYAWGFAGFGMETPDKDFSKRAQGIIRPLRKMLEEEAYLWSVNHEINKSLAWPTTYIIGAENLPELEKKPGKIIPLPGNAKIHTDEPGALASGVLQELQMVRNEIFDKTAPRSIRGLPETGVRSGYDRSLMVMEARLRYGSVNTALGRITATILGHAARLLETKIKDDGITIWGREPDRGEFEMVVKGSAVKGHYICYVEFAPAEVEDEYRRANTGAILRERGIISKTRAQEKYAGIIDPEEEQVQIYADQISENLLPVAIELAKTELTKEIMARQVKDGVALERTPTPEQVYGPRQRATGGSPTGAPFNAAQPPPFSAQEEQQVLSEELGKLK